MPGRGEVRVFDLVAPLYDRVMPPANGRALAAGLAHATRPIDRLLDVGGITRSYSGATRSKKRTSPRPCMVALGSGVT